MRTRLIGVVAGVAWVIILGLLSGSAAVEPQTSPTDTRQRLTLPTAQRDRILAEMRQLLASVSGIVQGIATNDLSAAEQAARLSGMADAADADPHIKHLLPRQFLELGIKTHRGFDQLADRIKAGASRDETIRRLAELTGNCVACHATYRLDDAR